MAIFVDNFGTYDKTYGSLAGVAVLMLWLWITAIAALLGAEINAEVEAQTAREAAFGSARLPREREAVEAGLRSSPPHNTQKA